jgi:hypothetical protein
VDRLQNRRAGDPHPFVDPARFRAWIQESRAEATKALQEARTVVPGD